MSWRVKRDVLLLLLLLGIEDVDRKMGPIDDVSRFYLLLFHPKFIIVFKFYLLKSNGSLLIWVGLMKEDPGWTRRVKKKKKENKAIYHVLLLLFFRIL